MKSKLEIIFTDYPNRTHFYPNLFIFDRIVIKFNVNHTVDSEGEGEGDENLEFNNQQQAQQEPPKLLSKPSFEVDIVKNGTTLSLSCTFLPGNAQDGEYGENHLSSFSHVLVSHLMVENKTKMYFAIFHFYSSLVYFFFFCSFYVNSR